MPGLQVSMDPAELQADSEALRVVAGSGISHVALAESVWNDLYGDAPDPDLLGFGRREPGEPGVPAAVWQAFKAEWRELACTDTEKYRGLRAEVGELRGKTSTVVVSAIAAGIAGNLGIGAGVLVPFVAILLHGVLTVGNNVVCRSLLSSGAEETSDEPG